MRSHTFTNTKTIVIVVVVIVAFTVLSGIIIYKQEANRSGGASLPTVKSAKRHRIPQKLVTLTFDDGPDPRYTPRILKILKANHIKATFFLIGKSVEKYPGLARQVAMSGNDIGNHSYTHPDLKLLTIIEIQLEVSKCQEAIYNATGQKPHYFRPPKGLYDGRTVMIAKEDGFEVVLWDATVEHAASHTAAREAQRIVNRARPAYIILAHDGKLNREKTVQAIPLIIKGLKKKGYRFVALDDFIRMTHHYGSKIRTAGLIVR